MDDKRAETALECVTNGVMWGSRDFFHRMIERPDSLDKGRGSRGSARGGDEDEKQYKGNIERACISRVGNGNFRKCNIVRG